MGGKGSGGARARTNNMIKEAASPKAPDAELNRAILEFNRIILFWDPMPDYSAQSIADRIALYIDHCEQSGFRPQLNAAALALGMTRENLYAIANEKQASFHGQPIDAAALAVIRKFYQWMAATWETNLNESRANPVGQIFIGKNHYGYQSEIVHTTQPAAQAPQLTAAADVANRYTITAGRAETAQLTPAQD